MFKKFEQYYQDERGTVVIEYTLIASFAGGLVFGLLFGAGESMATIMDTLSVHLGQASGSAGEGITAGFLPK